MEMKDREAAELARKHYEIEDGLTHIFRLLASPEAEEDPKEPVKLLEVHENTVAAGIMPVWFGPSKASGRQFSVVILEITPEEYQQVLDDVLKLPNGWQIGPLIPPPVEVGTSANRQTGPGPTPARPMPTSGPGTFSNDSPRPSPPIVTGSSSSRWPARSSARPD